MEPGVPGCYPWMDKELRKGLTRKQALVMLAQQPKGYPRLSHQNCGALFLSTPHSGSTAADWSGPLLGLAEWAFGLRQREVVERLQSFNDSGVASKEAFAQIHPQPPFECLCEGDRTLVGKTYKEVLLHQAFAVFAWKRKRLADLNSDRDARLGGTKWDCSHFGSQRRSLHHLQI